MFQEVVDILEKYHTIYTASVRWTVPVRYTVHMSEMLQANIFFGITSVAVVIATLFVCIILYQIIKLLQSIRRIVDRIDESSEIIAEDVSQLRAYVTEGSLVSQVLSFVLGHKPKRASKTKEK